MKGAFCLFFLFRNKIISGNFWPLPNGAARGPWAMSLSLDTAVAITI
jgi:hypothetical protein